MTKPIRTKSEYKLAKQQLQALIRSNSEGSKSDDIEVLIALIEHYERAAIKIEPPSAIAAVRLRMEQSGLTPRDLEPYIGLRARVSEVLSGKRTLSLDMIRALHEGLDIPLESLVGKSGFRHTMSVEVGRPILNRLNEWGFDVGLDDVGAFVERAFGERLTPALMRRTRTQRASAKTDDAALLLWQAAVLMRASKIKIGRAFDASMLTSEFLRGIARLSVHTDGPKLALGALEKAGIIALVNPTLPGAFLDGAAMLSHEGVPIVALTLRHDRIDNFWFTLLHELMHIARHLDAMVADRFAFFDDLDLATEDKRENEADRMAQNSLVPPSALHRGRWSPFSSFEDIINVSAAAEVHISIVAGRWQREHGDYRKFARLIERNTLRPMFPLSKFSD